MTKKRVETKWQPIVWPRADPLALKNFDIKSKVCTMNCGPSGDDPRDDKERVFLCEDCLMTEEL